MLAGDLAGIHTPPRGEPTPEEWQDPPGVETRLRRIVSKYGVPPAAARNLQTAIVQCTMLYAATLTWRGQEGVSVGK